MIEYCKRVVKRKLLFCFYKTREVLAHLLQYEKKEMG